MVYDFPFSRQRRLVTNRFNYRMPPVYYRIINYKYIKYNYKTHIYTMKF